MTGVRIKISSNIIVFLLITVIQNAGFSLPFPLFSSQKKEKKQNQYKKNDFSRVIF